MKSYLQFIGAGAHDSGPLTLLLFFDDRRYLINCAEGTQRAAILDSVKVGRVECCFVSSLQWQRIGGLAGLMCTLRDQHEGAAGGLAGGATDGTTQDAATVFRVVGPAGLARVMEATHPFVRRQRYPIAAVELTNDSDVYTDGFLTVHSLTLHPHSCPQGDAQPAKRMRSPPLPTASTRYPTMAYLFKPPPVPGKFDVAQAKRLGLKPGPCYGRLIKGESVWSGSGVLVSPAECVGPPTPHPMVVVADLPSVAHLELFLECSGAWSEFVGAVEEVVVLSSDQLDAPAVTVKLGALFKKARIHIVRPNNQLVNVDQLRYLEELNKIHQCYRVPCFDPIDTSDPIDTTDPTDPIDQQIKPFTKIHLFPERHITRPSLITGHTPPKPLPLETDQLRCSFLGTAAAIPGKYRNVSGILLHLPRTIIILDCGEGSVGQMARLYGLENLQHAIDLVSVVCLTHLHADHHLGAMSVMLLRSCDAPILTVFAPESFREWYDEYQRASGISLNIMFVSCSGHQVVSREGVTIRSFPVNHCPDAHGFRVDADSASVVYSGDCRPSDTLIHAAQHATILIHEATMPDDLHQEAVARKHCTVSEALQVAKDCQCRYCVLTHVTQRYAKAFPRVGGERVSFAADLMSFGVADLPGLISVSALLPRDTTDTTDIDTADPTDTAVN